MRIDNIFANGPASGGAAPLCRFTVALGDDGVSSTVFVNQMDEDAVANGDFGIGLPEQGDWLLVVDGWWLVYTDEGNQGRSVGIMESGVDEVFHFQLFKKSGGRFNCNLSQRNPIQGKLVAATVQAGWQAQDMLAAQSLAGQPIVGRVSDAAGLDGPGLLCCAGFVEQT